ncbi:hypothetical protein GNI_184390 [Gregarina niphandrodes]|uniref:Uncharacterized protein n=1 Tax=Gregarina niphandrodes TaxID=110365 RepID=A0A023AX41_GRENI|nr:hypothetical protein GNI_184390 [Gregarina niphandrodes]EZG43162.1 hypothetical protein GNI_184390 [Gregarina niphandrodes]|eukprot:XP_011133584.1 hypothetical protein GNI_184390 [Gregarina niphandrodes]
MPSKNMIQPKMRRRHWIVGCLLQHAGADTTRLARFCVKELEYNPRSCTKYPLLQCLAPQVRVSSSKKDTLERLSILEAILAKLPVVSAKEYAQLTQDQLNDDMRQTATAGALTLEPLIQDEWGAALTECETDFTGGTGPECETDFTGGMGPELFNETVSSRQIQQEHPPHLAKRKGIEGGSGSSLDGAGQSVLGAWGQSVVDAPTVEVPMVEGGDLLMAGGVSHSACVVRCDKTAGQPSKAPTIQQLERLVNQDQGTVVDDRFMDTFAEAVWKEYGPLLVPPMDHLMAELDHYLCAQ